MIIDLDQDVQIYKDGLHKISIINLKDKTVVTEDNLIFKFSEIQFVHII